MARARFVSLLAAAAAQTIPRTLFFTFESPDVNSLPTRMAANVDRWRAANPDYSLKYYGAARRAEYVEQHGDAAAPGLGAVFRASKNGAARADLWRTLVLFVEGGVAIDIDVLPDARPLSFHVRPDDEALLSDTVCSMNMMALRAGHPFLRAVLERAVASFEAGKRGTQELCGPTAYRAVAELVLVDLPRSFLEGGNAPDGVYRTREGAAVRVAPQLAGQDSYDGYQEDLASLNIKHWTVTEMETRYEGHKYAMTRPALHGLPQRDSVKSCVDTLTAALRKKGVTVENVAARFLDAATVECWMQATSDHPVPDARTIRLKSRPRAWKKKRTAGDEL